METERNRKQSVLASEREQWQKLQNFSEESIKKKLETETAERLKISLENASLKDSLRSVEAALQKERADVQNMSMQLRQASAQLEAVSVCSIISKCKFLTPRRPIMLSSSNNSIASNSKPRIHSWKQPKDNWKQQKDSSKRPEASRRP